MAKLSILNNKNGKLGFALVVSLGSASALSSPWLEANDPFLRSSLVLLSDAGQLSSPVSHYPLRWSMFADDLTYTSSSSDDVMLANHELLYTMSSAKLNRGNQSFKVLSASNAATPSSFGEFNEDEKGIYTSVEHLGNAFSSRLSVGYSEYQNETTFNFNDSYLAFSSGDWLWSVGNVNRWWGQGWQHNLILGSYAKAAPDVSLSYVGKNQTLGVWNIESILAQPDNDDVDYHSATRFVAKPWTRFEYGVTYQTWFADMSTHQNEEQLALDAKFTLPNVGRLYQSVYTEVASTTDASELGAWLLGWTGSRSVGAHTARIVVESQRTTRAHDGTTYPSLTDNVANTSYPLDDSLSLALYLRLENDHQFSLSHKRSTQDGEDVDVSQLFYRLPALAGMVRVGAQITKTDSVTSQATQNTQLWAGYEFRF